jgi:hypothetical protein
MPQDAPHPGTPLSLEEARSCNGFWAHSAVLHAISLKEGTLGAQGYAELKAAMLKDYSSWTLASALIATVGFAALLIRIEPITAEAWPLATRVCLHLYFISMSLSSMLALSCVNDFISISNYYNMVPAPYCIEARLHQYGNGAIRHPLTTYLQSLGLGHGSQVVYQSVGALCFGITNLIFMTHGPEYCLMPAAIFIIFCMHLREYNKGVHWHELTLPKLREQKERELGV